MNHQTDGQLLQSYAERSVESAFAELVQRHVDFVYSAAIRMVRDPHLAEDVTQGVFVALARNALQLLDRATLSGWLHRTAQNLAAQTVRTIERRRAREYEAVTMNQLLSAQTEASWEHIAPHLDAALGELNEPDRDAVVLRYFKNHNFRAVGATLGISDDAAQKRVSRAVEQMRKFLAKRGVTVGAAGLVGVISANAVHAAPAGLVTTISAVSIASATVVSSSTILTATKSIAMTTFQKIAITATLVAAAGAGIFEARQAAQLREHNQTLQQQQAPLTGQIERLQRERDEATNRLAALGQQMAGADHSTRDLLRLRARVTSLLQQNQELAALTNALAASLNENSFHVDMKDYVIPDSWGNAGIETATSAARTYLWAMANTNAAKLREVLSMPSPFLESLLTNIWNEPLEKLNGARIKETKRMFDENNDSNECLFTVESIKTSPATTASGDPTDPITTLETETILLRRTDTGWHVVLPGNREVSPEEMEKLTAEADGKQKSAIEQ